MGMAMFTGVALQKNTLGQLCFFLGVYFAWELLFRRLKPVSSEGQVPLLVALIILPTLIWVLYMSHSATSIAALIGALLFFLVVRLSFLSQALCRILAVAVFAGAVVGLLEYAFRV